jgi:hypothetical protein
MRIAALLLMAASLGPVTQGLAQGPQSARFVWVRPGATEEGNAYGPGLLGRGDRDYRYTGFYIGLGLGAAATLLGVANCSDRDNDCSVTRVLILGPVMTAVTGLTGALIGSLFPKKSAENHESS